MNNNINNNNQKKVLPSNKSKGTEKSKTSQAIAFIHDYDIYYKPKIHTDLVIRITTNGKSSCLSLILFLSRSEIKFSS